MVQLTTTRLVSFSRTTKASPESILRILHDPSRLVRLNPLVIDISLDPDTSVYTITDRLVFLKHFHSETKYQCQFFFHADGLDTEVIASAGTKLTSHYRVHVDPTGLTEITEQTTINVR